MNKIERGKRCKARKHNAQSVTPIGKIGIDIVESLTWTAMREYRNAQGRPWELTSHD